MEAMEEVDLVEKVNIQVKDDLNLHVASVRL